MARKIPRLDTFLSEVDKQLHTGNLLPMNILGEVNEYAAKLDRALEAPNANWSTFTAFWPPRYVEALRRDQATVFFGSGLSLPCGIPTWHRLLVDNFGLERSLAEDEDLNSDPLTMAELASEYLGSEKLQNVLRDIMNRPKQFSINHFALCALTCPAYVTTNYDTLFEKAWEKMFGTPIAVVTNAADLESDAYKSAQSGRNSVLFKIHGSSDRPDEHMILTRRDYRYHYRANRLMFDRVRTILTEMHTLFLGFGHRDPEVTRLVDDAIHEYERGALSAVGAIVKPQFYSLQFDMKQHTAEVYAARGIVALRPPAVPTAFDDVRSKALAVALVDLIAARQRRLHERESLDGHLANALCSVAAPLTDALQVLRSALPMAKKVLDEPALSSNLDELTTRLGSLASQGVYLLDEQGVVHAYGRPNRLDPEGRTFSRPLNNRPYFQQAKLFRSPFISNSAKSVLNGQSTVFLCAPVLEGERMIGLLFAATQVGQWKVPIDFARTLWDIGLNFLLIDGNGTCLLPPANEFGAQPAITMRPNEAPECNIGYSFERLFTLSKRDLVVRHIGRNVVPVAQDDDVLDLSEDVRQYTVVSQIPSSAIKIGISISVHSKGDA
jgi:hypothetical protein